MRSASSRGCRANKFLPTGRDVTCRRHDAIDCLSSGASMSLRVSRMELQASRSGPRRRGREESSFFPLQQRGRTTSETSAHRPRATNFCRRVQVGGTPSKGTAACSANAAVRTPPPLTAAPAIVGSHGTQVRDLFFPLIWLAEGPPWG
ncbi:hypothetical protein F441_07491 [Phytophthora nicotianae CJ01A1]|uniref:Uncharacterized protein n=6 Tax=Phytophthora nicotianae TaxID=4792 RepID=W2QDN4_PHYN3|nr:hypothetical protein PPTG_22730 [Phytophthora nicotianae INRA-310]ETI48462.1 hypothetical protein F443_07504 [Phytophthora nicotianae P1569]ETK88399.1 hypothetical protein L915_07335 [Phytophthora nicotianae]ETO77245.1 hypothetical protein F444_07524 [Phytophthora nicotianae P1976]ETP18253.1 hypothetical protein F441_07491 [Phytophthora nicotianae CJ01A1]ETP46191.1 hypothetical protein F442_07520 [Phytophthora nicotianae P10297]